MALGIATLAVLPTVAAFVAVRVVVMGVVFAAVVTVPSVVIPPVVIIGVPQSVVLARLPTVAALAISSHSTPALRWLMKAASLAEHVHSSSPLTDLMRPPPTAK